MRPTTGRHFGSLTEDKYNRERTALKVVQEEIKLLPWQESVIKAIKEGAKYVVLKAGRKSGKTEFMKYQARELAKIPPKVDGQINGYIAPNRVQAKAILWRRLKAYIPRDEMLYRPRESDLSIDVKNGIRIQLFGSENEDGIRGLTFGHVMLDEADFMRGGFYNEVVEPNLAPTQGGGILSSSPNGKWFTKLWRKAKSGFLGREWAAFHFTILDNPHIPKEWIENQRLNTPEDVWQREYMANENAMTGLQYGEFDAEKHVVQHKEPPSDAICARFLDWGWNHPSHCLWAEIWFNKETGRWNVYIFREFSAYGKNVQELCTPILAYQPHRNYVFTVIDDSAKRTEMATGTSILREFGKYNLPCRVPFGTDDYVINSAKMMLKRGDVQISENCRILIKQLQDVEWGDSFGDDAADAFKYGTSWIYDKDFAHIKAENSFNRDDGRTPIDPTGLIAARQALEPDYISWEIQ